MIQRRALPDRRGPCMARRRDGRRWRVRSGQRFTQRRVGYVIDVAERRRDLVDFLAGHAALLETRLPLAGRLPDFRNRESGIRFRKTERIPGVERVVQRREPALRPDAKVQIALMRATRPGQDIVQRAEAPAGQAGSWMNPWLRRWSSSLLTRMLKTIRLNSSRLSARMVSMCPCCRIACATSSNFSPSIPFRHSRPGSTHWRRGVFARSFRREGRYNASSPRRVSNSGWVQYRSNRRINMT